MKNLNRKMEPTNQMKSLTVFIVSVFLLTFATVWSQEPPSGPPDVDPTPFQGFNPAPLGNVIIPPFNATDPGSSILADGQKVELRIITGSTEATDIQWFKDELLLEGESDSSLIINEVTPSDAGTYHVTVKFNGSTSPSVFETFEVLPQSQIDDVFESWTGRFFSFEEQEDQPEVSGKTADPDLDSLSNLAEYFFGLSPIATGPIPTIDIAQHTSSSVRFSYPRARDRPDLILRIEGSNSLSEWSSLSTNEISITPINDTTEQVEMDVNWPFDPAYPRFIRLAIEQLEP